MVVCRLQQSLPQLQRSRGNARVCLLTASCLHMKRSTCWKSRGEPCSGTSYFWSAGLRETDLLARTGLSRWTVPEDSWKGLPHKVLHRATAHVEPKSSQSGAKQPVPSPFKASILQSTQEDVLKLRTPPLYMVSTKSGNPGPPFCTHVQNQIWKLNKASLRCQELPAKPTTQTLVVNSLKATSRKWAIKFKHMKMAQQVREWDKQLKI